MYGIIYVLIDPRTNEIRYVGQTVKTLRRRIGEHYRNARPGSHMGHWIMQLRRESLRPIGIPVSVANSKEELDALEIAFIAEMRRLGVLLVNTMPGGSPHTTEEWRARQSKLKSGNTYAAGQVHSEERRAEAAARMVGNTYAAGQVHTEERKAAAAARMVGNAYAAGQVHTEEWKQDAAVRMTGNRHALGLNHTQEYKDRLAQEMRGNQRAAGNHMPRPWVSEALRGKKRAPEAVVKLAGENHWNHRDDISSDEIIRRLAAGEPPVEIAVALNVTPVTIRRRARAAGWSTAWPERDPAPIEKILSRLSEGASQHQVAVELGVSDALISKKLKLSRAEANPTDKRGNQSNPGDTHVI